MVVYGHEFAGRVDTRSHHASCWGAALRAGTLVWAATFGIAWISLLALGLVSTGLVVAALFGSWIEALILASVVMYWPDGGRANGSRSL